jgi:type IV secretory pathway TraG/TraD family ATPase VirD4
MDINNAGEITVGTYFMQWWREMPAAPKKRWYVILAASSLFWMAGAAHAPTAVDGIARLTGLARLLMSLGMGSFSFLWRFLKSSGAIEESLAKPNMLWLLLASLVPGAIGLFLYVLSQPPNPLYGMQKMRDKSARTQGRVEAEAFKQKLAIKRGVPLVQVGEGREQMLIGLDYDRSEGHVIVVAPTRAGKGLHLTDTLRHYPGPVFVIDPKGEQFERTAALRRRLGPVYRLPGHQVHLSAYYRHLRDRDETIELHYHLLRPWASSEPIFAEKALSLFTAVGLFAQAKKLNPIRLLLDLAESNPVEALTALRTVEAARRHVDIFTNGAAPKAYQEDKFVTSALGNFTTRLAPYQKHIDTIAPFDARRRDLIVPPDWAGQNGTVYATYPLHDLRGAGGVVAAIIAAMLRYQMRSQASLRAQAGRAPKQRLLVAIDELPAVGLRNIADYLSTCGGYGITLLLYVQSIAQVQQLYGREGTRAILANCDHQLWYPAAEMETARAMSDLYGTTLKGSPMHSSSRSARQQPGNDGGMLTQRSDNQGASWSWREGAALTANEMMALPQGKVLAKTLLDRHYVFLGKRLDSIPLFSSLPGPERLNLPAPVYRPRTYTDWQSPSAESTTPAPAASETSRPRPELPSGAPPQAKSAGAGRKPAGRKPAGSARRMG